MEIHFSDAVIVGAGLAGERAAIEIASNGFNVNIISLVPPRQSHSNAAQGGVQASLANTKENEGDNWRVHFDDTVKGSDWGADQNVVEMVCKLAPKLVRELDYWGAAFSRTDDGKINQRPFGGASKPRCAFASDGTGHILLNTIDSQVMALKIPIFRRYQLLSLIHNGEEVKGIAALNLKTNEIELFMAKATILATGGAGRLFPETTNSLISFGDGCAIALETGLVPIGNPEAIQFHPTALVPTSRLVTEGCRGDGGALLDKDGKEFMWDYSPTKGNLASRDVVSRSMMRHIKKGLGIDSPYGPHLWLDIKRLGKKHIKTKLSDVDFLCRTFIGIDPKKEYIPVRPAQHYTMFGIKTNKNCEVYGLKRLFAVGECACWDLHGFNRLGGNSILETIAAGHIAGNESIKYISDSPSARLCHEAIKEYLKQKNRIESIVWYARNAHNENIFHIFREMQNILSDSAGIFRNKTELQKGLDQLIALREKILNGGIRSQGKGPNLELQLALRLPGLIKLAICITQAALLREESRGSHYREDFPQRDDVKWLKRTLAYFPQGNDVPKIDYEPTEITLLPPGDRGYGEKK